MTYAVYGFAVIQPITAVEGLKEEWPFYTGQFHQQAFRTWFIGFLSFGIHEAPVSYQNVHMGSSMCATILVRAALMKMKQAQTSARKNCKRALHPVSTGSRTDGSLLSPDNHQRSSLKKKKTTSRLLERLRCQSFIAESLMRTTAAQQWSASLLSGGSVFSLLELPAHVSHNRGGPGTEIN